jgi:hypothetical protein
MLHRAALECAVDNPPLWLEWSHGQKEYRGSQQCELDLMAATHLPDGSRR